MPTSTILIHLIFPTTEDNKRRWSSPLQRTRWMFSVNADQAAGIVGHLSQTAEEQTCSDDAKSPRCFKKHKTTHNQQSHQAAIELGFFFCWQLLGYVLDGAPFSQLSSCRLSTFLRQFSPFQFLLLCRLSLVVLCTFLLLTSNLGNTLPRCVDSLFEARSFLECMSRQFALQSAEPARIKRR